MLQIAVCDDNTVHSEHTSSLIAQTPGYETSYIRVFSSPVKLIDELSAGYEPDIAVVDIRMDEMNGISLAQKLNSLSPNCQIIFLSAYLEYATDAYDADHVYFVLKSQMSDRLEIALERAAKRRQGTLAQTMTIVGEDGTYKIKVDDVKYIERVLRKTRVVVNGAEYWTNSKPDDFLAEINEPSFFRCHQSYYVNMKHVISMNQDGFLMDNGLLVPVSRPYKHAAKERFLVKGFV